MAERSTERIFAPRPAIQSLKGTETVPTPAPRQPNGSDAASHDNSLAISLLIAGTVAVILALLMHLLLPVAFATVNAAIVVGAWIHARRSRSRAGA